MSYISDIFDKLDLQRVREFLLEEGDYREVSSATYEQRLQKAENRAKEEIKIKYPNMTDYETIMGYVYSYTSVVQNVYMEIGLQCGAVLAAQLLRVQPPK